MKQGGPVNRRDIWAVTVFGLVVLAGPACHRSNVPASPTHQVMITDNVFDPDSVEVSPGDTVTWVNEGSAAHTSTSGTPNYPDGVWDSGEIPPGSSYSRVFTTVGN